jgi:hypothetical protein
MLLQLSGGALDVDQRLHRGQRRQSLIPTAADELPGATQPRGLLPDIAGLKLDGEGE